MRSRLFFCQPLYRQCLLSSLTLLWVLTLALGLTQPAQAQTVAPGYIVGWGWNINGQIDIPPGLNDVVAVSASQIHSLALRSTGEVVAWGNDYYGAVTVPAAAKSGVTAIAAGSSHSLALKNGAVIAWGCQQTGAYGQCTVPAAATSGVTAIAAGDFHSLALKNGAVIAWGCPTSPLNYNWGQCDVPAAATSGITAIAAGDTFSLALRGDRVYSWGSGCSVPSSALSGVVAIAAGGSSAHCLALKSDGTVIAWGDNQWGQINVPAGLNNVVAIATGYGHSVAVKSDGTVVAWADNYEGRIGVPAGLTGVTAVAASWHNLVIVPAPRVTINQAAGQADPATTMLLLFTASFDRPVTNFTAADVTLGGTANRTNATITVSGGPSIYTISVDGIAGAGTVIATIAANVATDAVGVPNLASTSTDNSVTLLADTLPPVANPTQSPAAAPSGWNNTNVTVTWNWTDPTSPGPTTGIDPANCTTSSVASGSATVTVTATCRDLAGNTGTASYSVRIDPTAPNPDPSQSPAANGAGWNNTDVTVNWNWWFTGAIIDTANCTTSSTSSGEGTLTLTATCKDVALNQRIATYTVKVDKSAPLITGSRVTPANSEGWNNSAVTVDFTCQEQGTGSGLATNTVGGATVSTQGANQSATNSGTCVDVAGNGAAPATVGAINIDLTRPTTTAEAGAMPNANGWFKSDVPITFLCEDALSGIVTCSPDEILSSEGTAVSSTPQTSSDKAGNISDPSNIVTVKIDKTNPVVTVTGVSNGNTYPVTNVPTADCTTSDMLSGVATEATLTITGGGDPVGPSGALSFTATCSGGIDLAGNSAAPASVSYTVNTLINSSMSQQGASSSYNATPQACPANGGSLPFQTIVPTMRNSASVTFSDLFFRVKTLEYTKEQGGQQPTLCNATSGNGSIDSRLAIANSNLPGGDSQLDPGEDLVTTFQIGLPVRAQFRIFVDLYAISANAAAEGATQEGEYLGSFAYTVAVDDQEVVVNQLFLPLITR